MFEQPIRKRPVSARTEISTGRSDKTSRGDRAKPRSVDIPKEPWQVGIGSITHADLCSYFMIPHFPSYVTSDVCPLRMILSIPSNI